MSTRDITLTVCRSCRDLAIDDDEWVVIHQEGKCAYCGKELTKSTISSHSWQTWGGTF